MFLPQIIFKFFKHQGNSKIYFQPNGDLTFQAALHEFSYEQRDNIDLHDKFDFELRYGKINVFGGLKKSSTNRQTYNSVFFGSLLGSEESTARLGAHCVKVGRRKWVSQTLSRR
jgi:hypothetical protein